ncbi:exoribonuclease family protein [Melanomma pulvis-pyrius CBS 109.77]|uniref:Exoribonuclease family protein n=1 Tax=Melanomma pulvis-pyrius CBS 109.77 TaxID=1314802 RepID=A0A6A6WU32_9PLEO|nr:exoribonuclease family protein [Melanomma pulvis-pyrius CBS 109.77]
MNTDRRRINAPSGGTSAPIFARTVKEAGYLQSLRPTRTRSPNEPRKIFLQTAIIPSASGSAYLEIPSTLPSPPSKTLIAPTSSLKITASIQGPKPLPRSAPFSPSLLLTTTVKFAPFASRTRRGYIRDSVERDLGVHLETALRGVIIGERWPKSGVEVIVTVLEGDEDAWWGDGCITVASAAIADAGIDCVDMVSGGVAAIVRNPSVKSRESVDALVTVLDPCPAEHQHIVAACAVGYLAERDEITEIWMKGDVGASPDALIEGARHAAVGSLTVLKEVLLEAVKGKIRGQVSQEEEKIAQQDIEMTG